MLFMLILFIVLGLSIVSAVVFREEFRNFEKEGLHLITWSTLILMSIVIAVSGIFIIVAHTSYARNSILTEYNERYKVITTAMDRGEDLTLLVSDISNYNKEVLKGRLNADNLWINWFCNDIYDEIPLIEFEDKEN